MKPKHENLAAEELVLGKILQDDNAYWMVSDILQPMHFAKKVHEELFWHIRALMSEGKRLSLSLLQTRMGPEYGESGQSTMALMTSLIRNAEDVGAGMDGVEDIIEKWRKRKLIEESKRLAAEAEKENVSGIDIIADHEQRMEEIKSNSQAEPLETMGQVISRVVKNSSATKKSGFVAGFTTGLPSLDEILGRMHPGDLGIIGGRSGDGKSLLAAQIADFVSQTAPTLYFQMEMTKEDMAVRKLAGEINVSTQDIESGEYNMEDYEHMLAVERRLRDSKVYIDSRPRLRIDQIWARANYARRAKGVRFMVADHVGLVEVLNKKADKFERGSITTRTLKEIAKDLGMVAVGLAQVTRASQRRDDPRPTLNDFDAGSSVEQDCDWAIAVWRQIRYLKSQTPKDQDGPAGREWKQKCYDCKDQIELINVKRRRGEDGNRRVMSFNGKRMLVQELGEKSLD